MGKSLPEIIIVRDTREKENKGWDWPEEEKKAGKIRVAGMVEECLDAGDYSVKGYEDIIRIERKFGFSELFNNFMNKEGKSRFENELEKLKNVKHKYIIIESSINDDILSLSIPQYRNYGPTVKKIITMLFEYQIRYNIIPIFAGSSGKKIAKEIIKTVIKENL